MDHLNQKSDAAGPLALRIRSLILPAALLLCMGWSAGAEAQTERDVLGWRAGIGSGFNGGGKLDFPSMRDRTLRATPILRAHADKGVWARRTEQAVIGIALGPKLRVGWWETGNRSPFDQRNMLFDGLLSLRLTADFGAFRLLHGPAVGFTVSRTNDDAGVENPKAGVALDYTVAGVEWWFGQRMALFTDLGVAAHYVDHHWDDPGGNTTDRVQMKLRQVMLEAGILFGG